MPAARGSSGPTTTSATDSFLQKSTTSSNFFRLRTIEYNNKHLGLLYNNDVVLNLFACSFEVIVVIWHIHLTFCSTDKYHNYTSRGSIINNKIIQYIFKRMFPVEILEKQYSPTLLVLGLLSVPAFPGDT